MSKPSCFRNKFCECGQPAVVRSANSMACQRCADLTSAGDIPETCGVRDRNPPHVGWTGIRDACLAITGPTILQTRF